MASHTSSSALNMRMVGNIVWYTFCATVLALSTWLIVWGLMNWERGIYAGFHYNGARQYVSEVMAMNYGLGFTKQLRLAKPDEVHTHSGNNGTKFLMQTETQVREFHLVGPRGARYCVRVWDGGYNHDSDYQIVKGCEF